MAKQLPIQWSEVEKAALAGVPIYDIASKLADSVPELQGCDVTRLYATIRKRASRERWPMPDAILRRAQAKARVEAGVAEDAKQANQWRKGEDVLASIAESRKQMGVSVPRDIVDGISGELSRDAPGGLGASGVEVGFGVGGGLTSAPPTATELVTQSLVTRGQTGLSMALDAALASLQALKDSGDALPIRSQTDLLTNVKALQAAAGLDKPQVAIAVSLNSGLNSGIAGWECAETIDTITEGVG
jgi:hypothetical protein